MSEPGAAVPLMPLALVRQWPRIGDEVARREVSVDHIDLFLFSAACWLPHRIHYDADYARSEGLEDTPVQGPLLTTWLADLSEQWARGHGGHLVELTARVVAMAYPGDRLVCRAHLGELSVAKGGLAELLLVIEREDGTAILRGSARVRLSPDRVA